MKKVLMLSIALLMALSVWSQDHFALGLKGGFTSTQYTTNSLSSSTWPDLSVAKNDARSGFMFGAYARIKLLGDLSLQPELYYAKKSGKISYNSTDVSGDFSQGVDFHTWDIPILAHFSLIDLKIIKLYGITGPVMSFVAKNATSIPKIESKDDAKKATWGYQLGGGLEVWKLSLDARYEWGLSNVSSGLSSVNDVSNVDFHRKGNMLTISIGYRLIGL